MKYFIPLLIALTLITSCKKENEDQVTIKNLIETITDNHYEVAGFKQDGIERKVDFDDVLFTFGANRACTYGGAGYTVKTTYSARTEGEKLFFRFCYEDEPPLDAISKNWQVNAIDDTRISLNHTDDSTKVKTLLTLEQWVY